MKYTEFKFYLKNLDFSGEMLIAKLGDLGFESFVEEEGLILAYIPTGNITNDIRAKLQSDQLMKLFNRFREEAIADKNWNALWESQYEPVLIEDRCFIRAPFHKSMNNVEFDIVIMPKMSFGTAHHETTHQMIRYLLDSNVKGKVVLDMGCGTSVLAILASKMGAFSVTAIDNDEWAYNNSVENAERNNCPGITVLQGDATLLKNKKFDIILANINRNILLNDIPIYSESLYAGGLLFMSGFYEQDSGLITSTCNKYAMTYVSNTEMNKWIAAKYKKL